ncbi:unnamed protein product, partial [Iphiclides podalirius]
MADPFLWAMYGLAEDHCKEMGYTFAFISQTFDGDLFANPKSIRPERCPETVNSDVIRTSDEMDRRFPLPSTAFVVRVDATPRENGRCSLRNKDHSPFRCITTVRKRAGIINHLFTDHSDDAESVAVHVNARDQNTASSLAARSSRNGYRRSRTRARARISTKPLFLFPVRSRRAEAAGHRQLAVAAFENSRAATPITMGPTNDAQP